MKQDDVIAYIQPVFVDYDMDMVKDRINGDMQDIYAWKTMEELGILTVGGSDAPVESFDVLNNIYYAVTREHLTGGPKGGWLPHQKVTAYDAVKIFTANGAKACFMEDQIGRLLPGMSADMVVLSDDSMRVSPHSIKDIGVCATVVNGKNVYGTL